MPGKCKCECTGAIIAYAFAVALGWISFSLLISSVGATQWAWTASDHRGLWATCTRTVGSTNSNCVPIQTVAWLDAVRAFIIMGLIVLFIGNQVYSWSFWKGRETGMKAGFGLIYLSSLFVTIGASVYTGFQSRDVVVWGYAFGFVWAANGLISIAGYAASKSCDLRAKDGCLTSGGEC